jgi:hypothetical protein
MDVLYSHWIKNYVQYVYSNHNLGSYSVGQFGLENLQSFRLNSPADRHLPSPHNVSISTRPISRRASRGLGRQDKGLGTNLPAE